MEFIAIQELDLVINYKPGCTNQRADVLSGSPCQTEGADAHQEEKVVAVVEADPQVFAKGGEHPLEVIYVRAQFIPLFHLPETGNPPI